MKTMPLLVQEATNTKNIVTKNNFVQRKKNFKKYLLALFKDLKKDISNINRLPM